MSKSTIKGAMFNSYVKLAEGRCSCLYLAKLHYHLQHIQQTSLCISKCQVKARLAGKLPKSHEYIYSMSRLLTCSWTFHTFIYYVYRFIYIYIYTYIYIYSYFFRLDNVVNPKFNMHTQFVTYFDRLDFHHPQSWVHNEFFVALLSLHWTISK